MLFANANASSAKTVDIAPIRHRDDEHRVNDTYATEIMTQDPTGLENYTLAPREGSVGERRRPGTYSYVFVWTKEATILRERRAI